MTRLTETDVTTLTRDLEAFEARLLEATGLDLRGLALRTATDGDRCVQLRGARIAAVPMSSGEGVIPGFSACVVATLLHLGCDAWMTMQPDVRGIQAAAAGGATVLFLADDHRFIALSLDNACSVDDDQATADGYVTALQAAAGGLDGREVLLLGLGPVGPRRGAQAGGAESRRPGGRAGRGTHRRGPRRGSGVRGRRPRVRPRALRPRLRRLAGPGIIDAADIRAETIAAVPGMPSAFTPAAQEALGVRHIHEPLAIGVAVMAARALL